MSSKSLPITSEPSETYRELKAEADAAGLSVPEYLDRQWEKSRPKLTKEELIERLRTRKRVQIDAAELIRQGREERDVQVDEWLKEMRVRR